MSKAVVCLIDFPQMNTFSVHICQLRSYVKKIANKYQKHEYVKLESLLGGKIQDSE